MFYCNIKTALEVRMYLHSEEKSVKSVFSTSYVLRIMEIYESKKYNSYE